MDKINELKTRVLSEGILDDETIHHEFVSGMHGRKLDFDKIPTGSELYLLWVDASVDYIKANYPELPSVILGVANGANRLAVSIAAKLGNDTIGLMTEKDTSKSSKFHPSVEDVIRGYKPKFLLIVEDVGTAGTTSATAAQKALEAGAQRVEVLNTWQRSSSLAKLEEADVSYQSVIVDPLPNYQPDDCEYCKKGVELVEHE